jgi:hypothetical protein
VFFPDLARACQLASDPRIRAVGWLGTGKLFTSGSVDPGELAALRHLIEDGFEPVLFRGGHVCEICDNCQGAHNVLVPAKDVLYIAPEMIVHYIESHRYKPPEEFLDAVRGCPEVLSDEYFEAVRGLASMWEITDREFDQYVVPTCRIRKRRRRAALP